MPDDVSVGVAFDIDERDLETAFEGVVDRMGREFSSIEETARSIQQALEGIARPMENLVSLAEKFSKEMKDVEAHTKSIRENIASTRIQAGGVGGGVGGLGGAGGGGGLGSLLGMLTGGMGGLGSIGLGLLAGGGAFGAATMGLNAAAGAIAGPGGQGGSGLLGSVFGEGLGGRMRHSLELAGLVDSPAPQGAAGGGQGGLGSGPFAIFSALAGGQSPAEIMRQASGGQMLGSIGLGMGLLRGAGQGPLGMFAQGFGRAYGMEHGYEAARGMGMGRAASMGMSMLGGQMMPGMLSRYQQEAMQRYPQYLQQMASMATVGLQGGSVRQIMGAGARRFGYGPGEIGPEFSALHQGMGGGELTSDTLRTAMAYSRRYGVGMGAIGQAVGGVLNVGGGGQLVGGEGAMAAQREESMARIMADAVAAGFGRRLPEFSQAVGAGMQTVMSGPNVITQAAIPGMASQLSRLTGAITRQRGVGLQGAQQLMQPLLRAPGEIMQGLMSGEGDPYRMAMLWQHNQGRFGGSAYEMTLGMSQAMEEGGPFGEGMAQFYRGPLEEVLRSSPNNDVAMRSLQRLFPGMSIQGVQSVIERGRGAMAETGTLEGVDMAELFTGVAQTQVDEAEETRNTMREIQESGEDIMNNQLSAIRRSADFQYQQLNISSLMAENAETFHTAQMRSMTAMATFIQHSSLSSQMTAMANIFGDDFTSQVRAAAGGPGTEQERNTRIMRAFFQSLQGVIDPETLAEQMRQIQEGEAAAEPEGLRPVAARQAGAMATHGAGIRGEVREFLARPQIIGRENTTVRGQGSR